MGRFIERFRALAFKGGQTTFTPHDEFLKLDKTCDLRKRAYRELFTVNMDSKETADIRHSTNGNYVLGNR